MDRIDAMGLFVATVDAGSLSGAARTSGLSLSTVSRHLTALEERVGTKLLLRTTRALALTEAGRNYYERARQLLTDIDDLEVSLTNDAAAPTGHLTISGPTLFGRVYLLPILADFMIRFPDIRLDVVLVDRAVNMVEEGIDLAIRIYDLDNSNLMVRKLGDLRWVFTAAPEYLEAHGTPQSPDELVNHNCLLFYGESKTPNWPVLIDGKPDQVKISVKASSNTLDGVIAGALAGAGITFAPAWSVAEYVGEGRLKVVLEGFELPPRPINAVFTHSRLLSGKVRALLDCLVEEISRHELDILPEFGSTAAE